MGKKAKLKAIRKLADKMPGIREGAKITQKFTAQELYEQGLLPPGHEEGQEFNPEYLFERKLSVAKPINHHRKMKDLYNKQGKDGVNNYVRAVNAFMVQEELDKRKKEE